jgi:hypothetical protein
MPKAKIYNEEAREHFIKTWNACGKSAISMANHTGWANSTVYKLAREFGLFKKTDDQPQRKPRTPKYKFTNKPTFRDITRNAVALIKTRGY